MYAVGIKFVIILSFKHIKLSFDFRARHKLKFPAVIVIKANLTARREIGGAACYLVYFNINCKAAAQSTA